MMGVDQIDDGYMNNIFTYIMGESLELHLGGVCNLHMRNDLLTPPETEEQDRSNDEANERGQQDLHESGVATIDI